MTLAGRRPLLASNNPPSICVIALLRGALELHFRIWRKTGSMTAIRTKSFPVGQIHSNKGGAHPRLPRPPRRACNLVLGRVRAPQPGIRWSECALRHQKTA